MYKVILSVLSITFYITLHAQESYNITQHHVIDTSRQELYPHNRICPYREYLIHVWQPLQKQNKQLPLIIFSHGLGGMYNGTSYTWLCENLVQHGYCVVSISHSYACKSIVLSDGLKTEYLFPVPSLHYHNGDLFSKELETWVMDIQHVIDQITLYCSECDGSDIVVMGHSFGGSVAVQICRRDERVKCAINLDGPLYGENALSPFEKPVLCIIGLLKDMAYGATMSPALLQAIAWSWQVKGKILPAIMQLREKMQQYVQLISVPSIVHEMFSDNVISDERVRGFVVDLEAAHTIIVGYIHRFLDCYVRYII